MYHQSTPLRKINQFYQRLISLIVIQMLLVVFSVEVSARKFDGIVKSFSVEDNTVVIQIRSKTKKFKLSSKVKIYSNGNEIAISALEPGQKILIKKSKSKKKLRKKPVRHTVNFNSKQVQGWTGFRGSRRDNISNETGLLKNWPKSGPELLWETKGLGEGYSAVSIANGTIYSMGNIKGKEQVLALSLDNGEMTWMVPTGGKEYKESRGNGPRCTPTIDGDRIYALGANGDLVCLNSKTGQSIWSKNILDDFSAKNIKWAISESVLIDGEKLICTPGGKKGTIVALNKMTGKVIWKAQVPGDPAAGYASPIRIEVGGLAQYVSFTSKGVVSVSAEDGTFLWQDGSSANKVANCSTPLYEDGKLFYASGYGTGCSLLHLKTSKKKTTSKVKYQNKKMKNHHGGMILLDGYVYGSNNPGIMTCMDFKTGEVVWKKRSVGKGSIAYADGMIYLRSEKGPIALIEATPEGYKEKGRFDQPSRSEKKSWPHPVIFDGKLFIRDMDTLLCYKIKAS